MDVNEVATSAPMLLMPISAIDPMRYVVPGTRIIKAGAPPTAPPSNPAKSKPYVQPPKTIIETKSPTEPGVVEKIKTPGPGLRIIIGAYPWPIVEPGAVDDCRAEKKTVEIARGVPFIHKVRFNIVDVDIFSVIHRRAWRNFVQSARSCRTYFPGTGRLIGLEPNSVIQDIIMAAVQ